MELPLNRKHQIPFPLHSTVVTRYLAGSDLAEEANSHLTGACLRSVAANSSLTTMTICLEVPEIKGQIYSKLLHQRKPTFGIKTCCQDLLMTQTNY